MKFYNGKIRLGGSRDNEIIKKGMSAPEVILLRGMHGHDAIVDLEQADDRPVSPGAERERLMGEYKTENATKVFIDLFGLAEHMPLPTEIEGVTGTEKGKKPPAKTNVVE